MLVSYLNFQKIIDSISMIEQQKECSYTCIGYRCKARATASMKRETPAHSKTQIYKYWELFNLQVELSPPLSTAHTVTFHRNLCGLSPTSLASSVLSALLSLDSPSVMPSNSAADTLLSTLSSHLSAGSPHSSTLTQCALTESPYRRRKDNGANQSALRAFLPTSLFSPLLLLPYLQQTALSFNLNFNLPSPPSAEDTQLLLSFARSKTQVAARISVWLTSLSGCLHTSWSQTWTKLCCSACRGRHLSSDSCCTTSDGYVRSSPRRRRRLWSGFCHLAPRLL